MLDLNYFSKHPFSWEAKEKSLKLIKLINNLNRHHYNNCDKYKRILDSLSASNTNLNSLEDLPFLPVNLFKTVDLRSVANNKILRVMHSSGTTGLQRTKIFLDKENAAIQSKVLTKIVSDFIGTKRLPMLIIDNKDSLLGKNSFSAKTAAIRGFSIFAKKMTFAMNNSNQLDVEKIKDFHEKYKDQDIIVFGFTYSVYKDFLSNLKKNDINITFPKGILLHGGGWKKMEGEKIDNITFKQLVGKVTSIKKVHNYYGLIEQTGTIYMECEKGFFHASNFSDIFIRKRVSEKPVTNEKGMVQLISPLATSYPGHNILTEDIGKIYGEDDCKCGRKGKYFKIFGRLEKSEIRGCSDTIIG